MKSLKKCRPLSFKRVRVFIKFSVEVGKNPVKTKKLLGSSSCRPSVSQGLDL